MKKKNKAGFLLFHFVFFLFLTASILAQDNSIVTGVTDREWLQFMEKNAFNIEGLNYKMLLLAGELNLSADQLQEVKNLFSDHGDEKLLSRVAVSPGIRGSAQDGTLTDSEIKSKNANYAGMEDKADDAPAKTLAQVKRVRRLLGSRDLDFRFWFFEEGMIDNAEDRAYRQNRNYSADQLAASLLLSIERTPEFKDFKSRKTARLHSDEKVDEYFSRWQTLVERRVLLQVKQVKRRAGAPASGFLDKTPTAVVPD